MNLKNSSILFERGQKNLVGAVNSPVRAFKSVGGSPVFIERVEGSQIVDVDGNRLPDLSFHGRSIEGRAIVRGDVTEPCISAASIVAKTTRDGIMQARDSLYPAYAFARHKGYGTALHRERLAAHGPCDEHRRSFSPLKEMMRV